MVNLEHWKLVGYGLAVLNLNLVPLYPLQVLGMPETTTCARKSVGRYQNMHPAAIFVEVARLSSFCRFRACLARPPSVAAARFRRAVKRTSGAMLDSSYIVL